MLDKFIAPMIDNLLANYGLTRDDVYRLKDDAQALIQKGHELLPDLANRLLALEQATLRNSEALTILLRDKRERDAMIAEINHAHEDVTAHMNGEAK